MRMVSWLKGVKWINMAIKIFQLRDLMSVPIRA